MKQKGMEVPKNLDEKSKTENTRKMEVEKKKEVKKPVVKNEPDLYKLPISVYYAGFNHSIMEEDYPGKESLLQNEVLNHLQTHFGYKILTEKRTTLEYDKELNEIIVHLKNPSKGSFSIPSLQRHHFNDCSIRFVKSESYGFIIGPEDGKSDSAGDLSYETGLYLNQKVSPEILFDILCEFMKAFPNEMLAQIYYDRETKAYILHYPQDQVTNSCHIQRPKGSFHLGDRNKVLFAEIHSHGRHPAFFSGEDNENEMDFLIYGVIGSLNKDATHKFRIGFNGRFHEVSLSDLFDVQEEVSHEY